MVSQEYIARACRALRRSDPAGLGEELGGLIEECRLDLTGAGVRPDRAQDEEDPLIFGAVRCYLRWKFGMNNSEAALNREDYLLLRDELRKRVEYAV